jgi:hypothetical protein
MLRDDVRLRFYWLFCDAPSTADVAWDRDDQGSEELSVYDIFDGTIQEFGRRYRERHDNYVVKVGGSCRSYKPAHRENTSVLTCAVTTLLNT